MKKLLILSVILFALSISSLSLIAAVVDSQKDTVAINETVLFGDKSIADGITVLSEPHYDHHLFWNTEYTIGENAEPKTKFKFYFSEKYPTDHANTYFFQIDTDIRYGCDFNTPAEEQVGLSRVYKELYDSCKVGERVEKTVYLKDIYEYYPLRLNIILPNVTWSNNDAENVFEDEPGGEKYVINVFRDFFRIPVFEKHSVHISVGKDRNGGISIGSGTINSSEKYDYYFNTVSTFNDDTVFFTVRNKTFQGQYADFSLVPGGYGIYSFNYHHGINRDQTGIEADTLACVYPLDEELDVEHLSISADGKYLILMGIKNQDTVFTVIDIKTMTKHDEIIFEGKVAYNVKEVAEVLSVIASGDYLHLNENEYVKISENFIMLIFSEEFAIIEIKEDGNYELEFTAKQPNFIDEKFQFMDYYSEMVYDGNKLVIVNSLFPEGKTKQCGYYMAIYDKTGLMYYATYESSLDINYKNNDYSYNCHPTNEAYTIIMNKEK